MGRSSQTPRPRRGNRPRSGGAVCQKPDRSARPGDTTGASGIPSSLASPNTTTRTTEDTMKVFIAGATGALGRRLVPLLLARGHQVVAMTRSPGKARALEDLGAHLVVAEGLARPAVMQAVM